MSEDRANLRRRRGRRGDGVEQFEVEDDAKQNTVVYDFTENQVLLTACGCLVFVAVIAILGFFFFTLVNNSGVELTTCGGVSNAPENEQLIGPACGSLVFGVCQADKRCAFLQSNVFDVPANVVSTNVVKLDCEADSCETSAENSICECRVSDRCTRIFGGGAEPLSEISFPCRSERICPELITEPPTPQEQLTDCKLGGRAFGRCLTNGGTCEYSVGISGGNTVFIPRFCESTCTSGGDLCECLDLVCNLQVGAPGSVPINMACL